MKKSVARWLRRLAQRLDPPMPRFTMYNKQWQPVASHEEIEAELKAGRLEINVQARP